MNNLCKIIKQDIELLYGRELDYNTYKTSNQFYLLEKVYLFSKDFKDFSKSYSETEIYSETFFKQVYLPSFYKWVKQLTSEQYATICPNVNAHKVMWLFTSA